MVKSFAQFSTQECGRIPYLLIYPDLPLCEDFLLPYLNLSSQRALRPSLSLPPLLEKNCTTRIPSPQEGEGLRERSERGVRGAKSFHPSKNKGTSKHPASEPQASATRQPRQPHRILHIPYMHIPLFNIVQFRTMFIPKTFDLCLRTFDPVAPFQACTTFTQFTSHPETPDSRHPDSRLFFRQHRPTASPNLSGHTFHPPAPTCVFLNPNASHPHQRSICLSLTSLIQDI